MSLYSKEDSFALIKRYPAHPEELALRVYTSRLIGSDPNLVLHGGGNTSVKLKMNNITGEENEVIFVKGSGRNLATIGPDGFAAIDLNSLQRLRNLETISDVEMDNQLKIHRIYAKSPDPSVEALLHAFLPHKYVDHTHADSILILTHQAHGKNIVKEALGSRIAVLPYIMSGLPLAKAVIEQYERTPDIDAIVIINHGIFTFAEDAGESYEKMIKYVSRADVFIEKGLGKKRLLTPRADLVYPKNIDSTLIRCTQIIRGACGRLSMSDNGRIRRYYIETRNASDLVEASLSREAGAICNSGVLTPDHAIRTRNKMVYIESIPASDNDFKDIVIKAIDRFKDDYCRYFHDQTQGQRQDQTQDQM